MRRSSTSTFAPLVMALFSISIGVMTALVCAGAGMRSTLLANSKPMFMAHSIDFQLRGIALNSRMAIERATIGGTMPSATQ